MLVVVVVVVHQQHVYHKNQSLSLLGATIGAFFKLKCVKFFTMVVFISDAENLEKEI